MTISNLEIPVDTNLGKIDWYLTNTFYFDQTVLEFMGDWCYISTAK